MDAIILAAGRGTRMGPLTDEAPKPLLTAGARPLIAWQIDALKAAGATRIVINIAYLPEQFEAVLGDGERFGLELVYSKEPEEALETAGGIGLMLKRKLIRTDPFVVANGDVYSDFDYTRLDLDDADSAQLVMVNNPDFHPSGDFLYNNGRLLDNTSDNGHERLTFSGIGLYRQRLFDALITTPRRMKLAPVLQTAIKAGQVSATHFEGFWVSVDTPDRLESLSARLAGDRMN